MEIPYGSLTQSQWHEYDKPVSKFQNSNQTSNRQNIYVLVQLLLNSVNQLLKSLANCNFVKMKTHTNHYRNIKDKITINKFFKLKFLSN